MTKFTASIGTSTKISTAVVLIIMLVVGILTYDDVQIASVVILPAITVFIFGLSYYFSIKNYEVSDENIVVNRPFDSVSYKRNSIAKAEPIDKKDLRFAIRTFGIGGIFSYTGAFWTKKFGSMTWYITRTDSAVLLTTITNKKIVLSPDEREKFISTIAHQNDGWLTKS